MTASDCGAAAALIAAVLALSGCALLPKPPPAKPPPAIAHQPPPPPLPRPAAGPPASGSAAAAGRLTRPPAEPDTAPLQVVGMSQDTVRRLLGPPGSESARGAAQTWTYQGSGCSVDIVFYYDVTRSGFFALSEQLASGGEGGTCLARIHDAQTS